MWTGFVLIGCYIEYGAKTERGTRNMNEVEVVLQRHEQQIRTLERDMTDMKTVQAEIRSMHDTLVTLCLFYLWKISAFLMTRPRF